VSIASGCSHDLSLDLGDGLRLRRAAPTDSGARVALNARAYGRDPAAPDPAQAAQNADLLSRPHPTFDGRGMTVVEEVRTGRIVSSQHLSAHRWAYDGIPFPVGEIEHVATDPDYQRRGLVRAQTDLMHRWSAARGDLATAINGIPWYYTRFGYELALEKWGGALLALAAVPPPLAGAAEPYRLRGATADDLSFIATCYEHGRARSPVSYPRTIEHWRYDLEGRSPANPWHRDLRIVEAASGERVGFLSLAARSLVLAGLSSDAYELAPGVSWGAVTPSVARSLAALAAPDARYIGFGWLSSAHPAFRANPGLFVPSGRRGAWYIRVPDVAAFLRHVAPALEARLARSVVAGHSGDLRIAFYGQGGVQLAFAHGRILSVEPWSPTSMFDGTARFADQLFLQLLFGYRSLAELEEAFVYRIICTPEARVLLDALFPKGPSWILPVY
jgi:GNAT superfamily N-acetyltransferase